MYRCDNCGSRYDGAIFQVVRDGERMEICIDCYSESDWDDE